ncbi:hypothetical protein RHIZ404_200697 [Rhizobium sp. EC-SD404]|nr:hypothetical protein RHIZ404_200697 [Rhizobium sp. EC-SD404]
MARGDLSDTHTHDGVVVALSSNIRWCSDHLEIRARNGEVVRIVFVIDACDREIIAGQPWPMPASVVKWSVTCRGGTPLQDP